MAYERHWASVAPKLLTQNGTTLGKIYVASSKGFRVGMNVTIQDPSLPATANQKNFKIKRVFPKMLIVGPVTPTPGKQFLQDVADVSAYTVANGCFCFASEQEKSKVPKVDQDYATYETEPIVARRVISVDENGDYYNQDNPVPTIPGGDQISPPEFDEVVIDRDAEDFPIKYRFFLNDVEISAIDVTYNVNRSSIRYKRS